MDLDTRLLRALVAVVEHGSLSRAAIALHLSQPALGRQVRRLEVLVGTDLVERGGPRTRPTAAGQALAARARDILAAVDELALAAGQARPATPLVRIGWFQPAIASYLGAAAAEAGQEGLGLELAEMDPGRQLAELEAGRIDVALPGHACPELARRFRVIQLTSMALLAVLPVGHRLAGAAVALADLAGESWIGFEESTFPGRNAFLIQAARSGGFSPRFTRRADGPGSLLALVAAGQGISLIPEEIAVHAGPAVVCRPVAGLRQRIRITALTRRGERRREVDDLLVILSRHARQRSLA